MGKIYNITLNMMSATSGGTTNAIYNVDWDNLLPNDKKFKLTFSFNASNNWIISNRIPYLTTNLLGYTYKNATNGYQNSYLLGTLRRDIAYGDWCNFYASTVDNPPIYLDSRPRNNNLNVKILDNISGAEFTDGCISGIGQGNMTQAGFILTITTINSIGIIRIGTVITPTALAPRTITAYLTGTGGVGTYVCDVSANPTISTAVAYTFPADGTPNSMAPYILNLSFEELD